MAAAARGGADVDQAPDAGTVQQGGEVGGGQGAVADGQQFHPPSLNRAGAR
jgi:hypothetical protein